MDLLKSKLNRKNNTQLLTKKLHYVGASIDRQFPSLSKLIQNSGAYALSSIITPFISLALAPFLTHNLSSSEYGILTLLNTILSLGASVTQLGLSTAFFRAYNYDYSHHDDKRDVVATLTLLLFIVSLLATLGTLSTSSFLARFLLGHSSLSGLIAIGGGIMFVQNLTVPGFSWLRAENRTLFYSLLSIGNLLIALLANIILVGLLHWGIAGSLIATAGGYLSVVICTIPLILLRVGIKIRMDIARNLLMFGAPLILNVVSYWTLQLSDRYLLSRYSSLVETAKYGVSYNLGSALAIVVITPFTLAWPYTMYATAKTKNASYTFKIIFRWFSIFVLLVSFAFSFIGIFLLNCLFPVVYHSVAYVIPIVSTSIVFFGIYNVFMIGVNIKRKTWLGGIFTMIAAIVNFLLNMVLIPHYGALGAAISTLVAYVVLALVAYIVNQRIYPIAFEVGRFVVALLIGSALYVGSGLITQHQGMFITLGVYVSALLFYAGLLIVLGKKQYSQ
ncbi:lipopolysaccharide biosynthesis protein [Dictyobacter formicarum]|uniref:Polysaccharide biosynthesis protein C-terminal domain-containing protein n=1 Tax=Dictyobacter formicarum TaxID=2778368 RepID=A0ABQ3VC16_9CHLR|nr:polysaccharide biosynthesis C-terminal domain-containing protein [Dictyobacter formicarum]GHO82741.1 hypothetical protein KSZ_07470 [Dictyobacter formicarum]